MTSFRHEKHASYPREMYVNYAKSIGLGIERRVMNEPPRRPAEFWQMVFAEVDVARWRMRHASGDIRKAATVKTDV